MLEKWTFVLGLGRKNTHWHVFLSISAGGALQAILRPQQKMHAKGGFGSAGFNCAGFDLEGFFVRPLIGETLKRVRDDI